MKRYILSTIFVFGAILLAQSQSEYQIQTAIDFFHSNQLSTGDWKKVLAEGDIKGSPYLDDDFHKGEIYTSSKMKFVDIPLRYNIYRDNLEYKTPEGQVQELATPEIVEKAVFGDYQLEYIPFTDLKKIKRGFLTRVYKGEKASLYSRAFVNFTQPTEPGAYKEAEPAKFTRKPTIYYIRVGMEQAMKIGTKKDLVTIFPDHKAEIETFVKKKKVKTNKPEKLTELIKYYDSL